MNHKTRDLLSDVEVYNAHELVFHVPADRHERDTVSDEVTKAITTTLGSGITAKVLGVEREPNGLFSVYVGTNAPRDLLAAINTQLRVSR